MHKSKKDRQQQSTNTTHQAKDRAIQTSLKSGCEHKCFGRVSSTCSTGDTRRSTVSKNINKA